MKTKPKILVLKADGTNCDEETFFAFEKAGGQPEFVHINQLRAKEKKLKNYHALALPGGFSYGDDIVSGKILATELTSFFADELHAFVARKNTVTIGICNGFQTLIRTGLLPFNNIGNMDATLTNNDSGHFECRWVNLKIEKGTQCLFLKNLEDTIVSYQVAHGEGKFFASEKVISTVEGKKLVALRYVDDQGNPTMSYPANPNGSINAIAGITDQTGRILGLMPHPERFVLQEQHPNWRRRVNTKPEGLPLFKNIISFIKNA